MGAVRRNRAGRRPRPESEKPKPERKPRDRAAPKPKPKNGGALPRGPQALPRKQVAEHQRERLFKAMVECVDEHGYVATTISELVARASISRRSFYEQFRNKDECLLATYDTVVARLGRRLVGPRTRRPSGPGSWRDTFAPCSTPPAIGPTRRDWCALRWARPDRPACSAGRTAPSACSTTSSRGSPGRPGRHGPRPGRQSDGRRAAQDPVYPRARRPFEQVPTHRPRPGGARPGGLDRLLLPLARGPAAASSRPARTRHASSRFGGRAPGTLSAPSLSGGRGLPRGEHNLPRGFVTHNQRERIFDAIANLTAAHGYPALSLEDVAAEAAVSLQTFYAHFAGKEDAFIATYETGHARAMAVVNQTLARQSSWIGAVRAGRGGAAGAARLRALLRASGAAST